MKERDVDVRPAERRNGTPPARPHPVPSEPASALESPRGAPARVAVAEASPSSPAASRFGPFGALAKRIVARLIRFQIVRQANVDSELGARIDATASDVAALRRDLREAALDFGAIADRMHAFENVRRTVERAAPYRREVREHRRQLADAARQTAALSARVTFLQRETGPLRDGYETLRETVAEVREALVALERLCRETLETGLNAAASDGRANAAALSGAELRIAKLEHGLETERSASARDLAQRSAELRAVVEGVERRLAETAEQLGSTMRERAAEAEERVAGLRASTEADCAALAERIERAQRTTATLRTTVEAFARQTAADRDRTASAEERLAELEGALGRIAELESALGRLAELELEGALGRLAEVEGALDRLPDVDLALRRLSDVAGALNELRENGGPEVLDALRDRLDGVTAELHELRERLLVTPYMSAPPEEWPPLRRSTPDDFDYLGFENVFRGPEPFIRDRLRAYLPLLEGHAPVVELGSGRGEFLELLREREIAGSGVDLSADAVARTRSKGIDTVVEGDAIAYLASLPERSVGAIFSAQFAEHLPFRDLLRCLELARTRLVPGGLFIAETVNPNSIEGLKTFYVDPSHVKPLFPEVFLFLCRSMGFAGVRLFYPNGGGFDEANPTRQPEYAVVATVSPDGSKTAAAAPLRSESRRPPTGRSR